MVGLRRALGFWEATLAGVGVILGAGIYALIGAAAGEAGNAVWLSMAIAAVVAGLTGLSYAELSSMLPRAGAEFTYADKAFGKRIAFLIGWLLAVAGVIAAAAVALGFGGYLHALAGAPVAAAAVLLVAASTAVLLVGVKESARLAVVFTVIEAAGLLIILFAALPFLGSVDYFAAPAGIAGVFGAAALIFFAFIGFEDVSRLAEETRDAPKTIPRALLAALAISTVLYALVAVAAVSVLGWQALGASNAPLADVASHALGPNGFLILAFIALFSTSNTVVMVQLAASRVLYGMGRGHAMPSFLGAVHPKTQVPWLATIVIGVFAALFALVEKISVVADLTNFAVFIVFIVVNLSVIKLRHSAPRMPRPFKMPLNIGWFPVLPALGVVSCLVLFASLGVDILVGGALVVLAGVCLDFFMEARHGPKRWVEEHAKHLLTSLRIKRFR
ncbi:MAG: APC family permease [Candidatus Micrarchaeota archaeon]